MSEATDRVDFNTALQNQHTAEILTAAAETEHQTAINRSMPSVLWRPRIFRDGNKWCALYGENLQDGVAGFGDSPEAAMSAFDLAWVTPIPEAPHA